jgi:3-deoxy-D-manno-octulosonate 8-phosphate phosphatase (KDO 8-P phosphatase)
LDKIIREFGQKGDHFIVSPHELKEKLKSIKAFIFDWDGVFNTGEKNEQGSSPFNEVDSMGINMLRFSYWLSKQYMCTTAIISGEKNKASFQLSSREHYHSCYYKIADKAEALDHFCKHHKLIPSEVAFVFDDVLDLSIAKICGLRMLISRKGPSLFREYVLQNNLADYMTHACSGETAVREVCELVMGLNQSFDQALDGRILLSDDYKTYLHRRNQIETQYFTVDRNNLIALKPDF